MARNKILFCVLGVVCSILLISNAAFSEIHEQQNKLFTIDIPSGWQWQENSAGVSIENPAGDNGIAILFAPSNAGTDAEIQDRLVRAVETMSNKLENNYNGAVITKKEIQISGADGRQIDFITTTAQGRSNASQILLISHGYIFTITYGSVKDAEKALMEKVVAMFKFK